MNDKRQDLLKPCWKLLQQAQDIVQCPICMETTEDLGQCTVGHHLCQTCMSKLNSCPTCRNRFSTAKCFIVQDVSKILNNFKTSFVMLEKYLEIPEEYLEKSLKYKNLIKTLLTKLSTFLNQTNNTLTFFTKFISNSDNPNHRELERQLISLTMNLQNVKYLMNDTERTLTILKNNFK